MARRLSEIQKPLRSSKEYFISIEMGKDRGCTTEIIDTGSESIKESANLIEMDRIFKAPVANKHIDSSGNLYEEIPNNCPEPVLVDKVPTKMNLMGIGNVVDLIPPLENASCEECREHEMEVKFPHLHYLII